MFWVLSGVTVVQPLSEACDKHTTYNSFFQAKPTEGFIRVPQGSGPAPAPFTATTTYECVLCCDQTGFMFSVAAVMQRSDERFVKALSCQYAAAVKLLQA